MRVFIRMFTPIHPHKLVNASRSVLTCPNIGKMLSKTLFYVTGYNLLEDCR